jgi:SpoVK/Ycf46/Vps4 family AAA+-type ATPase
MFHEALDELLRARFPIIYLETFEGSRASTEIHSLLESGESTRTPRKIYEWSITTGLVDQTGKAKPNTKEPSAALHAASVLDEPAVFIFHDLHSQLGSDTRPADPTLIRQLREMANEFKVCAEPKTLVIISPVLTLPIELEKEVSVLDFPLPSESEIRLALEEMIDANKESGRIQILIEEEDKEKFAQAATGLTLSEAENAFARAMVNDGKLDASDIAVVLEEKKQTIRKSGLLEYIDKTIDLDDVGGLENLKRWLDRRNGSWFEEAKAFGLPAPKGVLITGVPGCGKSLTAKGMAATWGLPLLRLDIGKVFAGLVGSSEQNMRQAIKTAEAIAPCVLWVDEIEKGFSGAGGAGDSGTSSRVFGSFLTWMQEKSKPVFVIATANNIDRLPPEFLRKGRFDEIFFVDLPTDVERTKIWEIQFSKRLNAAVHGTAVLEDSALLRQLVSKSEGYSGAEIEQAVIGGLFEAFHEERAPIASDFLTSLGAMVPLSITQQEVIQSMRSWANVRAISASEQQEASVTAPTQKSKEPSEERGGRRVDF